MRITVVARTLKKGLWKQPVIAFLVLFLFPQIALPAAIRIMPLGDSITSGSNSGANPDDSQHWISYRKALRDLLTAEGYEVNYVGSLESGGALFSDPQHEGHGGWCADGCVGESIAPNVFQYLTANPAKIVLLHIGTNDVGAGNPNAADISYILDEIHRYSQEIWVILALIINEANPPCGLCTATTDYNNSVYQMVSARLQTNPNEKVIVVDMETGAGIDYRLVSNGGDMFDTLHPYATGYAKMANVWFDGLVQILPQANAGTDQNANAGSTVILNGTGSGDPDGTIATYVWSQTGGSPAVTLTNANLATANFTAPNVAGGTSLTFQLTVADADGFEHQDACVINVNGPPVANAGTDQTVNASVAVVLDGTGSFDLDGAITSYQWAQIDGSPTVALTNANSALASFTAPNVGSGGASLTFRLTVTDNRGSQHQDTCIVHVNGPPVAVAGPDQAVNPGVNVVLDGTGSSDTGGTIVGYTWVQTAGSPAVTLISANSATASFVAPDVGSEGTTLTFRLTVTDDKGVQGNDFCAVQINGSPVADAGPEQQVQSGAVVILDGSGSTDDGNAALSYSWEQTSGPAIVLSNPVLVKPSFTAPSGGTSGATLTFRLTVTDTGGLQSTDSCRVIVSSDGGSSGSGGGGSGGCFITAAGK